MMFSVSVSFPSVQQTFFNSPFSVLSKWYFSYLLLVCRSTADSSWQTWDKVMGEPDQAWLGALGGVITKPASVIKTTKKVSFPAKIILMYCKRPLLSSSSICFAVRSESPEDGLCDEATGNRPINFPRRSVKFSSLTV